MGSHTQGPLLCLLLSQSALRALPRSARPSSAPPMVICNWTLKTGSVQEQACHSPRQGSPGTDVLLACQNVSFKATARATSKECHMVANVTILWTGRPRSPFLSLPTLLKGPNEQVSHTAHRQETAPQNKQKLL